MKSEDYNRIYDQGLDALMKRLTPYRLRHSISVSETAVRMAAAYGTDSDMARVAGLLHDWDKDLSDEELLKLAASYGLPPLDYPDDMATLLHAQTGALAVATRFPELPNEIIVAISRHTAAAADMSDLDMIIYVSDMIEPLRSQGNLAPIRAIVGKVPLETVFLKAFEMTLGHLVARHRFIHPDSVGVWNSYVSKERSK
jgi:predicted HD superfamily hydrolase involved in NAD metabolism